MLRSLSGKQHRVITGVAIVIWVGCEGPTQEVTAFHEETRLTFSPLSEELIREYTAAVRAGTRPGPTPSRRVARCWCRAWPATSSTPWASRSTASAASSRGSRPHGQEVRK
nr:acetylserotonin O-methyltransferase-like protein [Mus musculus]